MDENEELAELAESGADLADDLDDPLGDLVAAGLLVAVRRGAPRRAAPRPHVPVAPLHLEGLLLAPIPHLPVTAGERMVLSVGNLMCEGGKGVEE